MSRKGTDTGEDTRRQDGNVTWYGPREKSVWKFFRFWNELPQDPAVLWKTVGQHTTETLVHPRLLLWGSQCCIFSPFVRGSQFWRNILCSGFTVLWPLTRYNISFSFDVIELGSELTKQSVLQRLDVKLTAVWSTWCMWSALTVVCCGM